MKKLLLTGFEPFLSFTINPTEQIVKELDGEKVGDFIISSKILPVDFEEAGERLLDLIEEINPMQSYHWGLQAAAIKSHRSVSQLILATERRITKEMPV